MAGTVAGIASQVKAGEADPDAELVRLHAEWWRLQDYACDCASKADTIGKPISEVLLMDIPALEKEEEAAWDAYSAVYHQILETPAQGFVGINIKLAIWLEMDGPPNPTDLIGTCAAYSALEDAKRISGQTGGQHV